VTRSAGQNTRRGGRSGRGIEGTTRQSSGERPPSPKRRRYTHKTMRLDAETSNSNSNSPRTFSNGSSLSPLHKAALSNTTNGVSHSQGTANSAPSSHTNGAMSALRAAAPTYFGHDREEVTRILIQSLSDLGYNGAAGTLSRESGYELESPTVAAFRNAVLQGEWAEAESLLFGSHSSGSGGGGVSISNGSSHQNGGLVLAEGADKDQMLFGMRQQKFLELLEERDLGNALMVLRQELTPLHQDIGKLHALSRYTDTLLGRRVHSAAPFEFALG